jgi:hypothetical protein
MRADFAGYLRQQGQPVLAQRLADRPGPFLISGLEPRLMPNGEGAPLLIVDLSAVGPEYMFAVVDAYDQPVPTGLGGRPETLAPIRQRLLGIFNRQMPEADLDPALKDAWVFRLRGLAPGVAAQRIDISGPAAGAQSNGAGASGSAPAGIGGSGSVSQPTVPTGGTDARPPTQRGPQP